MCMSEDKGHTTRNKTESRKQLWDFFIVQKDNRMRKIAIQGQIGSFHDVAAHRFFEGEDIELICCDTFEEVFEQIKVAFPHLRSTTENCMQSRLQRPITEPGQRDAFWTDCDAMDFTSLAKKYFDYHEESMLRRILRKMLRK